ncbi:UNVERIFIED_CONTAM: hypothetical protein BJ099_121112 [Lysinibacillus xylanilyticus]
MIEGIDLKKVNYIVKYGLSTGVFIEKLIKRRGNLLIVYGSTVNIEQYIRGTILLISIMLFLVFRL